MGFCYEGRKLCCDVCGTAGARKKKCPHGYCPPVAVCPACAKDKEKMAKLKAWHVANKCKEKHEEYAATRALEAKLLAEGKALRCSALGLEGGRVHVLFRRADGSCEGRYMSEATYHAVPFLTLATPETYEALGEVLPAPGQFSYGKTSKEAA